MVEPVGKKLCKARLEKGLTIDEAAHATKMRPDKILALENDDYSRFANNTYAKGFLVLYGRFLDVEVMEQARTLEGPTRVNVDDYQYLNHAPDPGPQRQFHRQRRRAPSIIPLVAFLMLITVGAICAYLYVSAQRLGSLDQLSRKSSGAQTSEAVGVSLPPAAPSLAAIESVPTGGPVTPVTPVTPGAIEAAAGPPEPVSPAAMTQPPIPVPADGQNEVIVATNKKTWVSIRKDSPEAAPIFEDYLYPDAAPLKLRGPRFIVESRDPAAVQIQKNGVPFAYQAPSTIIQ